ncbi:hypothetical protein [Mucilaginibacter psychrotolerans]|uniref:Uncharacterized protein n=1 Tax=Mucilaginibacter psychrotolerans TaxID=1524096 RepID=A0A4Y8RXT8_9SPHI|nr:hypothetical protein [Mucilaginibacter psychrotolerans]TFF29742.1 hypothetical protein E2R66_27920 [Mucilaginibacter psychrotolerans]
MDNIELSNGSFIKCKSLSLDEFDSLRLNALEGPIGKFKNQFGVDVYKLKNEEVIANDNGYYMLFNNTDDVEKVLMDANNSSQGTEILSNKNPFGKDFPNHTEALIKELSDTLGVKYVQPNEQLIRDLDSKLSKLPNASEFKKRHLINFIAVIGEVLLRKYKTEWEMVLSSDTKTWNPYLRSTNRPIEFFTYLYEDIYIKENHERLLTEIYETVNDIKKNQR